jgi:serine/threonine-protein kinase HipA
MVNARVEAEVRLHDRPVGRLTYDAGRVEFRYADPLLHPDHRVLGQLFEEEPGRIWQTNVGLPVWFANLLPEGGFRRLLERSLGPGPMSDYALLLQLGTDLPGAVTIVGDVPDDEDPARQGEQPLATDYRFSVAGVQTKVVLAESGGDRMTIPLHGQTGRWIGKLPDRMFPHLPRNEHTVMWLLAAAGIATPEVDLVRADCVDRLPPGLADPTDDVFVIRRFDRPDDGPRTHAEDFAQIADVDPRLKYDAPVTFDGIGAVVARLCGPDDFDEYIRRIVAMLAVGNNDMHLKNWSVVYPDGRQPRLSPAYDFVSTTFYAGRYSRLPYKLAGELLMDQVRVAQLRRLAVTVEADADHVVDIAIETANRLRAAWKELRDDVPLDTLVTHLDERFATLALLKELT